MNDAKKRRASRKGTANGDTEAALPKQARARETRRDLIAAARRIFARDGFDNARLEDIASAAGRTRGAFYDHFADKEDIFFALFEEDIARSKKGLRKRLHEDLTVAECRDVFIDHLAALLNDRQQRLLYLEFKLYAIRHPHRQRRLAELHAEMCFQSSDALDGLMPELTRGSRARRRALSLKISAIVDGLALNRIFDPGTVGPTATRAMVEAGIHAALGPVPDED